METGLSGVLHRSLILGELSAGARLQRGVLTPLGGTYEYRPASVG